MISVDWFDRYADLGLKAIPLYPRTKTPISTNWHSIWNKEKCREAFKRHPSLNMGLILGELIDVEGDTEEAEQELSEIIKDYPHPMYRSLRSTHHIFINPNPNLTLIKINGIEFRGQKHQSVLPPSIHETGVKYQWIKGTKFPIPKMPDELLNLIDNHNKVESKFVLKPGHIKLWCSKCGVLKLMHKKRHDLEKEIFSSMCKKWECRNCRKIDLRPACKKLKKQNKHITKALLKLDVHHWFE